ncbi:MAG: hypothetical protein K8T90_00600 [Planctomycetes bacterium]|nr:hypothetical protein [Planctomycetota bacterium]
MPTHRRRAAWITIAVASASLGGCAALGNVPPLHEIETGLPGGLTEERGAFGLLVRRSYPGGALESAIRPLVVERSAPGATHVREFLPPIAVQTESDIRRRVRVWPLFGTDSVGDDAERAAGQTDDDTMLLPFVGWGQEPGQDPWWMAFPFYGHLRQKLFSDEIEFAAFPIWAHTRDGDWQSTHLLWPLIAWGDGNGRSHRRVLPFWSQSDGPNGSRRTALWPIVHWNTETRGDRTFDGWFVFPAVGHRTSRDGTFEEWTALWPFFEWSDDARSGDRFRSILFPFYRAMDRPEAHESSRWWWPAYGTYTSDTETSAFYAWPIVWTGEYRGDKRTSRHTLVVPFWMERESGPKSGPSDQREVRSWPLFSFEHKASGEETLRVPEIIPVFGWRAGETAWADLVTLFHHRSDTEGRVAWDGPLGIVRWRRSETGASKLTLLWWIDIPFDEAAPNVGPSVAPVQPVAEAAR